MSYLKAPSTKLLATNCCVCGRALRDAVSVELGIGPVCREKHGHGIAVDATTRQRANQLVYDIAAVASHLRASTINLDPLIDELEELGFLTLAATLRHRLGTQIEIVITIEDDMLAIIAPYCEEAVDAFRAISGRRWDNERKVNLIPVAEKLALWNMLQACYPGMRAKGPKGAFTVAKPAAPVETACSSCNRMLEL